MLKENMHIGMKVAHRKCRWESIDHKYTEEELNAEFDTTPYYIVRWLERENDEINAVHDPKEHCVLNQRDLSKGDYREGNYSQASMLEPYDLVIKK